MATDFPPQTAPPAPEQAASQNGAAPTATEYNALMDARIAETARTVQAINDQLGVLQLELGLLVGLSLLILALQVVKRRASP